jgi:hypothetical protein
MAVDHPGTSTVQLMAVSKVVTEQSSAWVEVEEQPGAAGRLGFGVNRTLVDDPTVCHSGQKDGGEVEVKLGRGDRLSGHR